MRSWPADAGQRAAVPVPPLDRLEPAETDGRTVLRGAGAVGPDDAVQAGHYPGFALVPGLFMVQRVHTLLCRSLGREPEQPLLLERARFLAPVRPQERLRLEAVVEETEGGTRAAVRLDGPHGPVAKLRIVYPPSLSPPSACPGVVSPGVVSSGVVSSGVVSSGEGP
ncbi:hypothetical protein ACIQGZ_20900 [Streptomyces sp. NPDC092296]|uniref:hypothetical protein n=1 Tax=Streptomyces sp. NPDC092296 TaxID=3366012 RepID=UPI0038136997